MGNVDYLEEGGPTGNQQKTNVQKNKKGSNTPILDNFSRDLIKLAEDGKIDPIVGRDKEVKRMAQILSRKTKKSAIIAGEPGIGKTAIVEKLALMIVSGNCPTSLIDKRLMALDLTALVAGTKYRGQFEERIKAIIDELQKVDNVIIFIDEIHTMVGAGNSSGSMDVANILKPALARGEIQCIGATTLDEYKKTIEKDGALSRRFKKIILTEPTQEETVIILENLKSAYEKFHLVKYGDSVIETVVKLSGRYITDNAFPDKAIDVLDELGAEKRVNIKFPKIIEELNEELKKLSNKKIDVVKNQDYEMAAKYRDEEIKLKEKISSEKSKWKKNDVLIPINVDDVYNLITSMTGIPVTKMNIEESKKLLKLEETLSEKVIGQDEAIKSMAKAIRRNRVGLTTGVRPIGSFLCIGESGTGKTFLAKTLAEYLFGNSKNIIRIDMSEYMERHTITKLIGAPPSFVGYEEGGQLTEKVKNNPFSIILFDEIEKAHKDVHNILLQIMDDGRLTDSFGKTVDFTNTIIILTSNTGTKKASEFGDGIGFKNSSDGYKKSEVSKSIIMKTLKQDFKPEFLNRLDDIIVFNKLSDETMRIIVNIELGKLKSMLKLKDIHLNFAENVIDKIMSTNKEENYGARPVKRIIQNLCEDFIADNILLGNIVEGVEINVGIVNDVLEIVK
jgi:ATP-dependent Clp protease ATP-binding subunit ClpC